MRIAFRCLITANIIGDYDNFNRCSACISFSDSKLSCAVNFATMAQETFLSSQPSTSTSFENTLTDNEEQAAKRRLYSEEVEKQWNIARLIREFGSLCI